MRVDRAIGFGDRVLIIAAGVVRCVCLVVDIDGDVITVAWRSQCGCAEERVHRKMLVRA